MQTYYLANHVYASALPEAAIFLDLKSNSYLGIGNPATHLLHQFIAGWPSHSSESVPDASTERLVHRLLDHQIITTDPERGRRFVPETVPHPTDILLEWSEMDAGVVNPKHAVQLCRCLAHARLLLGYRRMSAVAKEITELRHRAKHLGAPDEKDLLQNLVSAYFHIQPFLYARRNKCLLDSLTLTFFLARYQVPFQFVIGVRATPFLAHSWVQHGSYVLNDRPERVGNFTPILSI